MVRGHDRVCAGRAGHLQLCCFSSRRRHTRFDCDWSSDVCSSDLSAREKIQHDWIRMRLDRLVQQERLLARREQFAISDRKSTRLNSSHSQISYAVFCLKKKKKNNNTTSTTTSSPLLRLP